MLPSLDYKAHSSGPFFVLGLENVFTVLTVCPLIARYLSHTVCETPQKTIFDTSFHVAPQCDLAICLHCERNVHLFGNQKS